MVSFHCHIPLLSVAGDVERAAELTPFKEAQTAIAKGSKVIESIVHNRQESASNGEGDRERLVESHSRTFRVSGCLVSKTNLGAIEKV